MCQGARRMLNARRRTGAYLLMSGESGRGSKGIGKELRERKASRKSLGSGERAEKVYGGEE